MSIVRRPLGPWRAVPVLGATQILAWGALFYPPVLIVPLIAAERGWSAAFAMGGFSAALLAGGLVAPVVGRSIDRRGGNMVMTAGSLAGAAGLLALTAAQDRFTYLAAWLVVGAAMAASLYDPAFATLGRTFGAAARRPIAVLTFIGGFASTVSWPATHFLLGRVGWRGTYLVYAALLLLVAAPLHAWALPRTRAGPGMPDRTDKARRDRPLPAKGWPLLLLTAGFAAYAFIPSGLSAHLLAIFGRSGLEAATVVAIGMLFGPAQVLARLGEFGLAGRTRPLGVANFALALLAIAFALLLLLGVSALSAAAFAVAFGASNGLMTIARGTVPLDLFGAAGYGALIGRMARPYLAMQAAAPLVLAYAAERWSDRAALGLVAAFALVSLGCFLALRRPAAHRDEAERV